MFYKNMGHYENTLYKNVREKLGIEIVLRSKSAKEFLRLCYVTSDRDSIERYGYDTMCYIKYECPDPKIAEKFFEYAVSIINHKKYEKAEDVFRDLFDFVGYRVETSVF